MRAAILRILHSGMNWLGFRYLPRSQRRMARIVLAVLVLAPLGLIGSSIYQDYQDIRQLGYAGLNHLLQVKDLFLKSSADLDLCTASLSPTASIPGTPSATMPGDSANASSGTRSAGRILQSLNFAALTNQKTLRQAYTHFMAAQADFVQVDNYVNNHPVLLTLAGLLPVYGNVVTDAKRIARAGIDIAALGAEVTSAWLTILQKLPDNPLSTGTTPLLTKDEIPLLQATVSDADHLIADLQVQLADISLNDLPVNACQRALFGKAIAWLPEARHLLDEANTYLPAAIWALGIEQPRNFLVQTLDRAELRGSGGFAGQYGVINVDGGRIGSLTLQDIAWLDYCGVGTCSAIGKQPPKKWSWWPFANYGLRDSNISADFPTTAQESIRLFAEEGGGQVDGVISLNVAPVEHILAITGPIFVPRYNETITAQNLEDRLHYYQLDPAGIAKERQLSADNTSITARKRFTALVGRLLQERLRQLPPDQLLLIAQQMLADLRSKDLEIYFSNPQAEALLTKYGLDAALHRGSSPDTWMLVQSNIAGSKASIYVSTTQTDVVTLDAAGGAMHHVTITLNYNAHGKNIYGYPTYRDYIRVYAPAGSRLISGYGFNSGKAMCLPYPPGGYRPWPPGEPPSWWHPSPYANLPHCSYTNPYPAGGLSCPAGGWAIERTFSFDYFDYDGLTPWPINYLSGPTNTASDEPGLVMWGGLVLIPPRCTATITLTWYTPKVAAPAAADTVGQATYSLLVQRQSGTFSTLEVTIIPYAQAAGAAAQQQVKFKGILSTNQLIALPSSLSGAMA